jgi:hypothetical protein
LRVEAFVIGGPQRLDQVRHLGPRLGVLAPGRHELARFIELTRELPQLGAFGIGRDVRGTAGGLHSAA